MMWAHQPLVREITAEGLEKAGYQVLSVEAAAEALEVAGAWTDITASRRAEQLRSARAAVLDAGPSPATELMVAYAYDTIHRGNPVSFFGMVLHMMHIGADHIGTVIVTDTHKF